MPSYGMYIKIYQNRLNRKITSLNNIIILTTLSLYEHI
jgi:hypothetical protein